MENETSLETRFISSQQDPTGASGEGESGRTCVPQAWPAALASGRPRAGAGFQRRGWALGLPLHGPAGRTLSPFPSFLISISA